MEVSVKYSVKQLNGKIYEIIRRYKYCVKIITSTGETFNVPTYMFESGLVTDNIEMYCKTKEASYLEHESIKLSNGDTCKIIKSLPNYVKVETDIEKMWCPIAKLLGTGSMDNSETEKSRLVGITVLQNCGMSATCIAKLTRDRIMIQFEDGKKRECDRKNFMRGGVSYNKDIRSIRIAIGDIYKSSNGLKVMVRRSVAGGKYLCIYEDGVVDSIYIKDLLGGTFSREDITGNVQFNSILGKYV